MFDPQFCIIDLFGHTQIAGLVSEQEIAGQSFLRVDVPEVDGQKAFTRFYGQGAIYSILPVDKETGMVAVKALRVNPVNSWTVQDIIKKLPTNAGRADHHWEAVEAELEDEDFGTIADREYAMHKDDLPDDDEEDDNLPDDDEEDIDL